MKIYPIIFLVIALWTTAGCEKEPPSSHLDILEAAANGNLTEIKTLLDNGADVNAADKNGVTALMLASADGYQDIVELLLARGADISVKNANGETALQLTFYSEIKAMLRNHSQPATPATLCYAARVGDLAAGANCLTRGVEVNSKEYQGMTALIEASQEGNTDIVELLLAKGADIDAKTDYGLTALIAASQAGRRDVVKVLLEKGAEVNAKNTYGDSALSVASGQGYEEIVEMLRQYRATAE